MTDFLPFPLFILLAALLACLLILLVLVIVERVMGVASGLVHATRRFKFKLLEFEYEGDGK